MAMFPKIPSSKDLLVHLSSVIKTPTHSNTTTLFGCPLALSDSLSIEDLSMLSRIDVYRLWHSRTQTPIVPNVFFYYDNIISKPALSDAKSIVKQKKETDLLLHTLGLWALTQHEYINFLPGFSSRIWTLFATLFNKWCISYTHQSVYWNTRYQTIAPFENIRFETKDSTSYVVKYFVSTKNHSLDIYVEDPSTIFGDVAIAINPLHKKAKLLKGQMVIIPIINRTIPIIIDERVNFADHGALMRITPWHDTLSLAIAKDHNLPLDIESYDSYGNFSEHAWLFAGKSVEHFMPNIIQNLADIGNLISTKPIHTKIPFSRITNEMLFMRTHQWWFLEIPETTMQNFLDDESTRTCFNGEIPEVSNIFPVSTPSKLGYRLPIWTKPSWENIVVDENTIIKAFVENKGKPKNILISLIMFHAIQEGNLPESFALEDAISCLFSEGFTKDQTLFANWISMYTDRYPQYTTEATLLTKVLEQLSNNSADDVAITHLASHLENAFGLVMNTQWMFSFDMTTIDTSLAGALQSTETISAYLLHHLLVLDTCEFFDKQVEHLPISLFSENEIYKMASCSLLWYFFEERFPWSKSFLYSTYNQNNPNSTRDNQNIKTHVQTYGSDVVRLHLIDTHTDKTAHNEQSLQNTLELFHSFWNASRYIKTNFFAESTSFGSIEMLYRDISAQSDDIHAFDNWIIWSIQSLLEEAHTIEKPVDIAAFSHRILQFMKEDFSIKYLELIKTSPSACSHRISLLVSWVLIKLFFPYAPLLMSELWAQMEFEGDIRDPLPSEFFPGLQKSYLISLFMDLVDKFSSLKINLTCKKHDPVSIFIKANPDFLKFCQSHETLLQKSLHADDITYLPYNEQAPSSYVQEDIIDITIGIKRFSKDNPFCLAALIKKLAEKQDHLQYLRNLLSSLTSNWWSPEVIVKKREEIQNTKDEIEQLELEINKLKMHA